MRSGARASPGNADKASRCWTLRNMVGYALCVVVPRPQNVEFACRHAWGALCVCLALPAYFQGVVLLS